jgi:Putative transposase
VRVLRWFARSGLIDSDDVREMLTWENSGFSLDAEVRIAARDRAGLERRLRYCARPPFALERLDWVGDQHVIYRLPRAQRDGSTALCLTPLELIDHLAALIPPPRLYRHRYHGVLAPNSPVRAAVTTYGRDAAEENPPAEAVSAPAATTQRLRRCAAPVISGPCCWHGCSSRSRWFAPTAARTCASSPS